MGLSSFFFPGMGLGYGMGYGFGGGILNIVLFGFMFSVLIQVLQGMFGGGNDDGDSLYGDGRVSVARVQVGLLGSARGLQKDLDNVAKSANTSGSQGLQYVLQGMIEGHFWPILIYLSFQSFFSIIQYQGD